jgi:hypothetical protein
MSSSWRDSGHSKGYLHFSTFSYGNGGTKSSKKCWNVTDPPIIMVVCKASSMSVILSKIKNQTGEAIFRATLHGRFIR